MISQVAARSVPVLPEAALDAAEAGLRAAGWVAMEGLFASGLLTGLYDDAQRLASSGRLRPAGIGRGEARRPGGSVRGDRTLWLDEADSGPAARAFLAALDALRVALGRRLLLGLDEVEAHYALYPPGAAYARHRDRFRDDGLSARGGRVLSLACYLNPRWGAANGGALRLHLPDGARDFAPSAGTTVLFLSDEVEHEVLPATRPRYSVAAWFRQRGACPL